MAKVNDYRKIQKLRTLAMDFALAKQNSQPREVPQIITEKPSSATQSQVHPPKRAINQSVAKTDSKLVGNPPFHFLRESSAEETLITPQAAKAKHYEPKKQKLDTPRDAVAKYSTGTIIPNKKAYHDRDSILADEDEDIFKIPSPDKVGVDGNIITDKKRDRKGLLTAVYTSIKNWIEEKINKDNQLSLIHI